MQDGAMPIHGRVYDQILRRGQQGKLKRVEGFPAGTPRRVEELSNGRTVGGEETGQLSFSPEPTRECQQSQAVVWSSVFLSILDSGGCGPATPPSNSFQGALGLV